MCLVAAFIEADSTHSWLCLSTKGQHDLFYRRSLCSFVVAYQQHKGEEHCVNVHHCAHTWCEFFSPLTSCLLPLGGVEACGGLWPSTDGCVGASDRQVSMPSLLYPNLCQAPIEAVLVLPVAENGQKAAEINTFTDGRCSVRP